MKKAIALLVALAAALSIGVTGFAAETGDGSQTTYLEWSSASNNLVSISQNDLLLVLGTSTVVRPETPLTPGKEYTYKIFRATQNEPGVDIDSLHIAPLTGADVGNGKLRVRNAKGSTGIASAEVREKGSGNARTYELKVTAKENYGTKITDVEFAFNSYGTTTTPINEGLATFKVGYPAISDTIIDAYGGEGDVVTIPTTTPVIKKAQFERLASTNDYKPVEFEAENGGWRFMGRVSGMPDTNFIATYDVVPDVIKVYPDQDYKFLTFQGGVNFPTNGEMRIDVSDLSDYNRMYTYLYRNGSLTPVATTYDNTSEEIVFRTNYLGSFLITDTEITGRDLIDNETVEPIPTPTTPTNPANPNTGADTAANVLVTLGIASLAVTGAISRKKK